MDNIIEQHSNITIEEPEQPKQPECVVVDMTKHNIEIKPFNPDYVHKYDPEGDKPSPSSKSVEQILLEEQEEAKKAQIVLTEEEIKIKYMKELVKKLRCIESFKMFKNPLINFIDIQPYERKKIIEIISKRFTTTLESETEQLSVNEEFNDIVQNVILASGKDFSNYIVYD